MGKNFAGMFPSMIGIQGDSNSNFNMMNGGDNIDTPDMNSNPNLFSPNLANELDDSVLQKIGSHVLEGVKADYESMTGWREIYNKGIVELGLADRDETQDQDSESKMFSSAYKNNAIQFISTAMPELLRTSGYCDYKVIGSDSNEIEQILQRRKNFMNFYLQDQLEDFTSTVNQIALYSYIGGSGFGLVEQNPDAMSPQPILTCIRPDNFIIDKNATSVDKAPRKAIYYKLDKREIKKKQSTGYFKENLNLMGNSGIDNNFDNLDNILDTIQGFNTTQTYNSSNTNVYEIYKCFSFLNMTDFDIPGAEDVYKPYIITIEKESGRVLRLEENWYIGDPDFKEKNSLVHFTGFVGFGIMGIGLAHLASNDARVSAEIENLLITASKMASMPGGFKQKGLKSASTEVILKPGEFTEIDGAGFPLSEAFLPFPFKDPSPILMSLYELKENNISQISNITSQQLSTFNGQTPATTIISLLEQFQKPQSALIKNLHFSLSRVYRLMDAIFSNLLTTETYPFEVVASEAGEEPIPMAPDFKIPMKIVPISDPNDSSSILRIMKAESVVNMIDRFPEINRYEALYSFFTALGISNIDKILPNPEVLQQEAFENALSSDPISENIAATSGAEIKVNLQQNDDAHILTHNDYIMTLHPEVDLPIIMKLKLHVLEHEKFKYLKQIAQNMQFPLDPQTFNPHEPLPPEIENAIAEQAAGAAEAKLLEMKQTPKPLDPAAVMLEDVKVKDKIGEQKAKYEHEKNEVELEKAKINADIQEEKMKVELIKAEMKQ